MFFLVGSAHATKKQERSMTIAGYLKKLHRLQVGNVNESRQSACGSSTMLQLRSVHERGQPRAPDRRIQFCDRANVQSWSGAGHEKKGRITRVYCCRPPRQTRMVYVSAAPTKHFTRARSALQNPKTKKEPHLFTVWHNLSLAF